MSALYEAGEGGGLYPPNALPPYVKAPGPKIVVKVKETTEDWSRRIPMPGAPPLPGNSGATESTHTVDRTLESIERANAKLDADAKARAGDKPKSKFSWWMIAAAVLVLLSLKRLR